MSQIILTLLHDLDQLQLTVFLLNSPIYRLQIVYVTNSYRWLATYIYSSYKHTQIFVCYYFYQRYGGAVATAIAVQVYYRRVILFLDCKYNGVTRREFRFAPCLMTGKVAIMNPEDAASSKDSRFFRSCSICFDPRLFSYISFGMLHRMTSQLSTRQLLHIFVTM